MADIYTRPSASDGYTTDSGNTESGSVTEKAKAVGHTAAEAGGSVAQTAKEQGREVAGEAVRQTRNLYHSATSELRQQAGAQQQRAVGGIRSIGGELRSMAESGTQSGPVGDYAHQAAAKIDQVADWLESREPGAMLNEVKDYARRHPGTFLAGAALLGVLAGRVTRSVAAEVTSDDEPQGVTPTTTSSATTTTLPVTEPVTYPAATPAYPATTTAYPVDPAVGTAAVPADPYPGADVPGTGVRP